MVFMFSLHSVNPTAAQYKYTGEALRAVTLPLGPIGKDYTITTNCTIVCCVVRRWMYCCSRRWWITTVAGF